MRHLRILLLVLIFCFTSRLNEIIACDLDLNDVTVCNGSSAVLGLGMQFSIGSVPSLGAITSFQWTSSTGFTSTQQHPILNNPQPGTYTLTIQAPGCGSVSATLNLSTTSTNCPNAAFTNTSGVICSGNSVSFTNNSTPGGLSYFWLFGDGGTASTSNTSHVYTAPQGTGITNYTAALVVVNAAGVMDVQQSAIQVQQIPPEPQLNSSQYQLYNNQDYLVACTDLSNDYIFITGLLNSPGAWAQSFTINWGDGSPIESFSAPLTFTSHLYPLGLYTLTITMLGPNGCSISNTYKVFVGNTPAVNLGSPGNTERCAPYTFNFPIENVGNNEIGTTYVVTFSDGGATQTFNHPPPAFFTHTFTQSSCGQTSLNNLPDAFWVQITAQNPCANAVATIEPIRISTPPVAQFTALPDPVCINTTVSVNSTADPGTNVSFTGCNTNHGMVWSISPATGWTLSSGTLGSVNGQPTTYTAWTSGSTQLQLSFSQPGNYTITQRIRNSCGEDVATEVVCVVPPLTANFTLSGPPCAPSVLSTDNLTTPTNTCVPPVYVWSILPGAPFNVNVPPFTANSFEPKWLLTQEGLYTVNLSATNACGTSTATNTFTIVAPPDVNLAIVPPGCAPYTVDPSVTYDDGGGTISLQEWQINAGPWQTITPSEPVDFPPQVFNAGTHTIKVRITNECGTDESTVTFTVTDPPIITVADFAVCDGVAEVINNGNPTVNPATGAPPISYSWSGNGLSNTNVSNPSVTLSGAGQQDISLTATDVLGCSATDVITVTIQPLPVLNPVPNSRCVGSPAVPLSVSSNINPGTTFSWSPATGLNTTTGSVVLASPANTTTYTITGTVNATGCISDTTVALTVNPLPVVTTAPIFQVCAQAIPVELTQGNPAGGIWSDPTPATGTLTFISGVYNYTPPTTPGNDILNYTYTDANGCVNSDNMPVQILPVDPAEAGPNFSVCNNAPSVPLNTGAPASGVWSGPGVSLVGLNYTFTPSAVSPGSYWLFYTINSNTNCEFSDSLLVTVFPAPSVNPITDETCSNLPITLTPNVSGGTAPLLYAWTPIIGLQSPSNQLSATFVHEQVAPNDALYNYNFTVTDVNNCVASNSISLTVHPLPVVDVIDLTTSICTQPIPFQMNVDVTAVGGGGIWTGNNISSTGLFTPPSTSGSQWVYFTHTDINGCINEDSTLIDLIIPVVPDAGLPLSFCLNTADLILTPATNPGGIWTGAGVNADVFDPLLAGVGTHNLTYTINQGTTCQTSDVVTYTVFPIPTVDAGNSAAVCSGVSISLNGSANGGTGLLNFLWSPSIGIISGQGTASIQIDTSIAVNQVVQNYVLTVSDQNNCTVSDNTLLTINPLPFVEAGPDSILCDQPIVYPLQGFSPLSGPGETGIWSGSPNLSGTTFTPNGTGTVQLTYTFTDVNGCISSDNILLTINPAQFPNSGSDLDICNNAAPVQLQPVNFPGGFWSGNGVSAAGLFNPVSVMPGTYTLVYTINDGTTCETTDALDVTVFQIPQIESLSEEVCSEVTAVLQPDVTNGTQPYTYQWTAAIGVLGALNQQAISIEHVQPAPNATLYTYTLTVTDDNDCVVSGQQNLTVNPLPVVEAGPDSILCNQPIVYPLQGFSPLTGSTGTGVWSGSPNLLASDFTPNGNETVQLTYTFTDNNGCVNSDGLTLTIVDPQFPNAGNDFSICNNAASVQLQPVTLPGGIWSGSGVNTADVFNPASVAPGTYTLVYTINDGTTCETTDELDVTIYDVPIVGSITTSVCSSDSVTLAPAVNGGTTPYVYLWSPVAGIVGPVDQSSAIISHIQPPSNNAQYAYTLTVTDANNCVESNVADVTIYPLPVVTIGPDLSTCFSPGVPLPIVNAISPAGGTWLDFPGNVGTLAGLNFQTGGIGLDSLSYTFTDNNGCTNSDTLVIEVISPISVEAGPPMAICETDAVFDLPMPLPANPPANYTTNWIGNGVEFTGGVFRFNPALADPGVNTLNYSFQEIGNTCAAGDELQIYVGTVPQPDLSNFSICTGLDTTLTVAMLPSTGTTPYIYQWDPNSSLSSLNTASPLFTATNNSGVAQDITLTLTVTDSVGCVGTVSPVITINPLPIVEAGPDSTLCNQPIAYPLGGYSPTTGGIGAWSGSLNLVDDEFTPNGLGSVTLTYTFTDDNGCVNSDQVSLLINPPIFPNAGPDEDFCLEDAAFTLLPITQPGGIWSGAGVSQVASVWQFDPGTADVGTHTITYTINIGTTCETNDTRTFNVWPMPQTNAGLDMEECSGITFSLMGSVDAGTGTAPFQYQWSPSTGLSAPINSAAVNGSLSNPGPGQSVQEYFLTVTDNKGCSSIDSMEVTINPLPVVEAGPDSTLCNQPIAYSLGGYSPTTGGIGAWSGSLNLVDDEFTPNGVGTVTLTYTFTDDNGCINSDQVSLTINPPIFPNAGLDEDFCLEDAAFTLLPITQPGGIWSGAGVSQVAGVWQFDAGTAGVGTHTITYTINTGTTCETNDTRTFDVWPMPQANAGPDFDECSGIAFSLTGIVDAGTGTAPFQYQWSPSTGLSAPINSAAVNGSLSNPGPGQSVQAYFLTVTDNKGCISIDSMEVTINPLPVVNAGPDSTLCNQPIAYPLGDYSPTTGGTGVWGGSPNLVGDEFTPNGVGTVNLTYTFTDDNGCVNSDQVSLTIVPPIFPNAGPDLEFCAYDSDAPLPLTTVPGGVWSGTGVVQTATGYDFSPALSGTGVFTLVYTIFDGTTCETTDEIQITVHPPPIVEAGEDISVCISDACINLTGFSPSTPSGQLLPTAYFYGEGGVSASGQFCPAANAPGDYTIGFHYTETSTGCFNTDELVISNHPLPVAEFSIDDVFCTNTDAAVQNLSQNDTIYGGIPEYNWNVLNTSGDTLFEGDLPTFNVNVPDTGIYHVHLQVVTEYGCMASTTESIYLIETPYPAFTLSDDTACAPVQIAISNTSDGYEVAYSWLVANASVSPPDTVYYSNSSAPPDINFPSPTLGDTTFIVRLILGNECGSDTVVQPFVGRPTPVARPAVVNDTACSPFVPDFLNLSYGTPTSYFWDFGNGNTSTEFDPEGQVFIAIDNDTTTYEILLVATNECGKDSATVTIVVLPNTVTAFFNTDPPFGCADLAVDFTNVSSGADQFFWDFGDGTSPVTSYNANHVFEIGGVYTVEMIASDGCSYDTAYATVNVLPKPDVSFIPVQDVICQGSVAAFINTSQGAVAYLWNFGDNEQIAAFEPPHVYVEPGIYPVRLIGYSPVYGCPDTVFQNITVQAIPDLSVSPNPSMGCMPLSVTLINNSTNVTSYEWDFGNGETSNSPVPGVEYLQPGDYNVNLIAHNYNFANNLDCPIDTQLTITVFETPVSSFSLDINTSCGDTARVGVSNASQGADSYLWKWEDNQSFLFEPSIFLSDTGLIPIDLVCSNIYGCRDTTTEFYDLIGQPDARMRIRPPVGCEPLDVKFNSLSEYGDSWMWNFGDGTLNSEEKNPEHTYETAGLYSVSLAVSNEGKCFADTLIEFAVEVKRRAIAGLEFEPDNISLGDPVINLTNTSSFASSFVLDMGDGATYNDFINQHIYTVDANDESVLLTFIANNSNNCPDTLYKSIDVIPSSGIFVANSFTPDGDGINDFWAPVIDGKVNFYTLLVFNRWGEQIFTTTDRNKQWDGWYQDRPVQIDVYVYHLIVSFEKEDKKMRRIGRVSVIR